MGETVVFHSRFDNYSIWLKDPREIWGKKGAVFVQDPGTFIQFSGGFYQTNNPQIIEALKVQSAYGVDYNIVNTKDDVMSSKLAENARDSFYQVPPIPMIGQIKLDVPSDEQLPISEKGMVKVYTPDSLDALVDRMVQEKLKQKKTKKNKKSPSKKVEEASKVEEPKEEIVEKVSFKVPPLTEQEIADRVERKLFECKICGGMYASGFDLGKHKKIDHGDE